MSSSKLFVVAIDFGTTYSGYAFSNISEKEKVFTYNWNEGNTHTPKTPTSILFNAGKEFHSFGHEAEEKYAVLSQIGRNKEWYFFKRFKLILYKNDNLNEKTMIPDFTGRKMLAIDVFSAGIRYLKEHLFTHFQTRIEHLRESDIHWVLTVPAIWDETAKKFMRTSAEQAGIPANQLTLALEPESAALYCQLGMSRCGLEPVRSGEKFLLLDCGGGTVDVTVHEVLMDKSFKEIHRASGGPWGGVKVDDAFQEYLLEIFDFELISSLSKSDVIELERNFELLKKKVDTEYRIYTMQVPLSLRQAATPGMMVAGKLRLNSTIIKAFFDKPVTTICNHIQDILSSLRFHDISTLILVGGFAESKVVQDKIRCTFSNKRILTPKNPASAVVEGAVEFGHCPDNIRFRMSPYTYGVKIATPFLHYKHPNSKKLEVNGKIYCTDIFSVHVSQNEVIETGTAISNKIYCPIYPGQTCFAITVVISESMNPTFVDDPGNRIVGSFDIQIPTFESGLDRNVNVKMIFSGTELTVEARNMHTKKTFASQFRFH